MDNYDYENDPYGLGEDYYGEGSAGSTSSSGSGSKSTSGSSEPTVEIPSVPPLDMHDPRRLTTVDLTSFEIPRKTRTYSYSAPKKNTYSPSAAISYDPSRVSMLPLVDIGKPVGVAALTWQSLDTDGFTRSAADIRLGEFAVGGHQEAPGQSVAVRAAKSAVSSEEVIEKEEESHDPSEMPFLDHLEEFRWALLKSITALMVAMIASWFLSNYFYRTLTRLAENAGLELISTKLMEPIMLKLQMALAMGIIVALPFVLYFIWSFVAPGLYQNEKRWILPTVYLATLCFLAGASIAYFIIIPFILPFIKQFLPADIVQMITIGDFVAKILKFMMLFGIMFEMPLVTFALAKIGIIKYQWMTKYRKYAIVSMFIIGAVLTPPDPISQIMMAAPLIILYEISIFVAKYAGRDTLI